MGDTEERENGKLKFKKETISLKIVVVRFYPSSLMCDRFEINKY